MKHETFFTSDTHFGHSNIIKYCQRPFSDVMGMDREMTRIWNEVVHPHDTVYHLGDFAFGNVEFVRKSRMKLNGKIILVQGNHDRVGRTTLLEIFDDCQSHLKIKIDEQFLYLSHHPIQNITAEIGNCYFLNGHVHDLWKVDGKRINVGVDVWDFKPKTWQQLKRALEK